MALEELAYMERFIECSKMVANGKNGAIRDDKVLKTEYRRSFYKILEENGLEHSSGPVRAETILLLSDLHETAAYKKLQGMRNLDIGAVSDACISYMTGMRNLDTVRKDLMFILSHKNGVEFRNAVMRMADIATDEDIPELRVTYGRVEGKEREEMRRCLSKIIDRYPELENKRRYILSVPVFPDEKAFDRFMDKSIVYLDIRYRDSISPKDAIAMRTYNNIVDAIRKMQIRIYNERDNLWLYEPSKKKVIEDLEALIIWAAEDLSEKEVIPESDNDVAAPLVDLLDSSNS